MDVTKVLASVPILKNIVNKSPAQSNATREPTDNANAINDELSLSIPEESLNAEEAETLAGELKNFFEGDQTASLGADTNTLASL